MTFRGIVKNGVVVLEPPATLAEGQAVEVLTLTGAKEQHLPGFGLWRDRTDLPESSVDAATELRRRVESGRDGSC